MYQNQIQWVIDKQQSEQIFIDTCLGYLEKESLYKDRIYEILEQFIYRNEINGIGDLDGHVQETVIRWIRLEIANEMNYFQEKIKVEIEDSRTLMELRVEIAKKAKCCWEQIEIHFQQQILAENKNGHTIKQLNIKDKLQITKKNQADPPQAQLFIDDQLNPKLKQIFKSWFQEYSEDQKMYPNNCVQFINSCTGDFCNTEDKRIKELYYQWDQDNKGYLDENDFLEFYKDACEKKQRVVWNNLQNKNFRSDLSKISEQQVSQIEKESLTRYKLMKNQRFFQILLEMEGYSQISLLKMIPTSEHIFQKVKNNIDNLNLEKMTQIQQWYYLNTLVKVIQSDKKIKIQFRDLLDFYDKIKQSINFIDQQIVLAILKVLKSCFHQDELLDFIPNQKFKLDDLKDLTQNENEIEDRLKNIVKENLLNIENEELFMITQQLAVIAKIDLEKEYLQLLFSDDKVIRQAVNKVVFLCCKENYKLQQTILEFYSTSNNQDKFSKQFFQLLQLIVRDEQHILDKALSKINLNIQTQQNLKIVVQILRHNNRNQNLDINSLFTKFLHNFEVQKVDTLYELSKLVLNNNKQLTIQFLQDSIFPTLKQLKIGDDFMQDQNNFKSNYVGIKNPGCICYMNAMLQQFFMVNSFRKTILLANDQEKQNLVDIPKHGTIDDNVLHQVQKMFAFLQDSIQEDYDPFGFCYAFKDYEGNPTNIKIQQDAYEFLNLLFDRLENQLKNTAYSKLIENVFGGQTCTTLTCLNCKNQSNKYEVFNSLSLEVKNFKNLQESLKQFIQEEYIQDYYCEHCKEKQDVGKATTISSCPNYLILHLKRIIFDFETFENLKVNSQFDFTNSIDISPYCLQKEQQQEYQLVGIVVHIGVAQFGHYISYIKNEKGTWNEFNDSLVSDFDPSQIQNQCFGGNKSNNFNDLDFNNKNAYMLIYEKNNKSKFLLTQNIEFQNQVQIQKDDKIQYEINFDDFPNNIVSKYDKQIQESNKQFIILKNIYNQQFYQFIEEILESLDNFELNDQEGALVFQTYLLLILKLISRSKLTQNIEKVCNQAIQFIKKRNNLKQAFAIKLCEHEYLSELLIKSNDRNVRSVIRDLLVFAIQNYNQYDQQFIQKQFQPLTYIFQFSKNCNKLQQYFEFLLEMTDNPQLMENLSESNLVNKLLQFFQNLQNYQNISTCLDLILKLIQKNQSNLCFIKLQDFFERVLQSYKEEYVKDYLVPISHLLSFNNDKNTIFIGAIILQSFYEFSQDKIQILFILVKYFLKIKDQYQEMRIHLIFGSPNYKNLTFNNKQGNNLQYEFNSIIQIQRSQTFLESLLSQKNKFNIIQYFLFLYQLMKKNNLINDFVINLPSPNIMCRSFLDWIKALLDIIQRESKKIWPFQYEDELNLVLELNQQIHQQIKNQDLQIPQYHIDSLVQQSNSSQRFGDIKVKQQDFQTLQKNSEEAVQTLKSIFLINDSNQNQLIKVNFEFDSLQIPNIQEIILILQPNQAQKVITFQKIHLDQNYQTNIQIKNIVIDHNLNEIQNIYQNYDKLYDK